MRALLACVLAAIALAGCAGDPAPLVVPEPTFSDIDADWPGWEENAPLRWQVLGEAAFTLAHAAPHDLTVSVPLRTVRVIVNFTLEQGAIYGLDVTMGACAWSRDLALLGNGATYGVDCGGLGTGTQMMRAMTDAGAVVGRSQILALVCEPEEGATRCPPALPVTGL